METTETEITALFGTPVDTRPVGDQPMHVFWIAPMIDMIAVSQC